MHYFEGIKTIIETAQALDPKTTIYLLGSYAQGTETPKSDVDVLIIHQYKDDLVRYLKKSLKNGYASQDHQFDVKILSHNELNKAKNIVYFTLYSMIKFGRKLEGEEIRIKLQPDRIRQEYVKQIDLLKQLEEDVEEKKDYQTVAALIFGVGKTLRFMERVLMKEECKSLKEIFGRNLVLLGKEYKKTTRKNDFIKTSLSQTIRIKGQGNNKGSYNRLTEAIEQVREYGKGIEKLFDSFDWMVDQMKKKKK